MGYIRSRCHGTQRGLTLFPLHRVVIRLRCRYSPTTARQQLLQHLSTRRPTPPEPVLPIRINTQDPSNLVRTGNQPRPELRLVLQHAGYQSLELSRVHNPGHPVNQTLVVYGVLLVVVVAIQGLQAGQLEQDHA